MLDFSKEIALSLANDDEQVTNFVGGVKPIDMTTVGFGDVWTFPQEYKIFNQKIGNNIAQYVLIELESGEVKRFYPSTFTKNRGLCNEDGTPMKDENGRLVRVHTTGSAAEEYRNHGTVEEAMNALKGKRVKVTEMTNVRTLQYGTTTIINTTIPKIDFWPEQPANQVIEQAAE